MKKNLIAFAAAVLLIAIVCMNVNIQTVDEYYLTHLEDISSDSKTVTFSVTCETILENYDSLNIALKAANTVPADGVVLPSTEYVLRNGDTVFDILNRALQYNQIHFDYSGSAGSTSASVYVKGINNIYEYDCGDLSGWMYSVNGEFPQCACSDYVLSDGDVVEWKYSCDLGRDLGCYYDDFSSEVK